MRTVVSLLALAGTLAACADLGPGDEDLRAEIAANRRTWEAKRPPAYVCEVERLCFCGEDGRGPVRVRVVSGGVQARAYTASGAAVPSQLEAYFPGVEGLFDILEDAVERDAHQIQVTWDPESGIPMDFWIDYQANLADEEQGYRVVAAPQPLS